MLFQNGITETLMSKVGSRMLGVGFCVDDLGNLGLDNGISKEQETLCR